MIPRSYRFLRNFKLIRSQYPSVSSLNLALLNTNWGRLPFLNFNLDIAKRSMHSQPEESLVGEKLGVDALGSPKEDAKRNSDSLDTCTTDKQDRLSIKQKETLKAEKSIAKENAETDTQPKIKFQLRKTKKTKKLKPTELSPLVVMDLHTLNPKLINNPDNKEYLKTLFYQYLPFELYKTYEVDIVKMASNGRGIGKNKDVCDWFILVPFTIIGDKVLAKVVKNTNYNISRGYSEADLVEVLHASENRRLDPPCKYAGSCGGCQWQHIDYENQLELKKDYLKRAFFYGSRPAFELIPFDEPERSPLKTAYRTKLTPHFDAPKPDRPLVIGFNQEGWRRIMDIEDCILATPTVSQGYKEERVRVKENLSSFKRGATLIIRDSDKGVITNHKHTVTQSVGDLVFEYPAVNASILPRLTEYVMDEFRAVGMTKYLLDVYCGSGLFAVACSSAFEKVVGVDISDQSISCASHNAEINSRDNCSFKLGNAEVIFDGLDFLGDETAVIIDPPRKGCSEDFIRQLIDFGPQAIVYVSCNPFTQARDLLMLLSLTGGLSSQDLIKDINNSIPVAPLTSMECINTMSLNFLTTQEVKNNWNSFELSADQAIVDQYSDYLGLKNSSQENPKFTYRVVKVKPFDMFPQTMHIESLLTLVKVPLP